MILNLFLSIFLPVLQSMIDLMPDIALSYDSAVFSTFFQYVSLAFWVLPSGTILSIIGVQISVTVFRIMVSMIKSLWDLIPFL